MFTTHNHISPSDNGVGSPVRGNRLACLAVHGIADQATISTFLAMSFAKTGSGSKAISKADWLIRLISRVSIGQLGGKILSFRLLFLLFTIAVDKFVDNL